MTSTALTWGTLDSIFDKRLQAGEGLVPLRGDGVQILAQVVQRARIKFEATFATGADMAHEPGSFEHTKMLGDGLARQTRAGSELRDRMRLPRAEPVDQR